MRGSRHSVLDAQRSALAVARLALAANEWICSTPGRILQPKKTRAHLSPHLQSALPQPFWLTGMEVIYPAKVYQQNRSIWREEVAAHGVHDARLVLSNVLTTRGWRMFFWNSSSDQLSKRPNQGRYEPARLQATLLSRYGASSLLLSESQRSPNSAPARRTLIGVDSSHRLSDLKPRGRLAVHRGLLSATPCIMGAQGHQSFVRGILSLSACFRFFGRRVSGL